MGAGIQADVSNAAMRSAEQWVSTRPPLAGGRFAEGERRILLLTLVALLAAGLPACRNRKAAAAPVSPPPPAVDPGPVAPPPGLISEPQTTTELPAPQPVPPDAVPTPLGPLAGLEQPGEPATEPPPQPQPPVQGGPSDERPTAEGTEVSPPVPRLGQILTAEERQTYNRMIDNSIEAARRNLTIIVGHKLRPDQQEAVRRIRAFIEQAGTARERDLALARNLADRALLLAEDLARSFR